MDSEDKEIYRNTIARHIGEAVSRWIKKNGIEEDVVATAVVRHPTLYVDELGVCHSGPLITVQIGIGDEDDDYDDDDDDFHDDF